MLLSLHVPPDANHAAVGNPVGDFDWRETSALKYRQISNMFLLGQNNQLSLSQRRLFSQRRDRGLHELGIAWK